MAEVAVSVMPPQMDPVMQAKLAELQRLRREQAERDARVAAARAQQAPILETEPQQPPVPRAASPAADEVASQASLAKILEDALETDFEKRADEILAARGLKRPEAVEPYKISPWAMIAALGPALGALVGRSPAMAAPGAAAVLAGHRGAWEEREKQYQERSKEYASAAGALAEKMAARSEQRLRTLLPYLTMTASERAQHGIRARELDLAIDRLDFDKRVKVMDIAIKRQEAEDLATYRNMQTQIEILKSIDAVRGKEAELRLEAWKAEQNRLHQLAMEKAAQGQVSIGWYNASTSRMRALKENVENELNQVKLQVLTGIVEAARVGSAVSPQLDAGARLLFPNWGKADAEDRMVAMRFLAALQKGGRIDPTLDKLGREAMVRLGMEVPGPEAPGGMWRSIGDFFRWVTGGWGQTQGPANPQGSR